MEPNMEPCLLQVLQKFDGSTWRHHVTRPTSPLLGQKVSGLKALEPPLPIEPGVIAAHHSDLSEEVFFFF